MFNGNQAVRRMSGICAKLTAGVDVQRPLLIASANGASEPESGPGLKARSPPEAAVPREFE